MDKQMIEEMARDMDYGCVKRDLYPDDAKEIAKALYLLGYRKIPEGAVVLTMEEFQGYRETQQHVFEDLQRTRKEMAKEIYEWLIENICESEFAVIMTYFRERYGVEVE